MFGGWYIIAQRVITGRPSFVIVLGPTKTAGELTPEMAYAACKAANVAFRTADSFEHVFMLQSTLVEGSYNQHAWITVTRDEWKPT